MSFSSPFPTLFVDLDKVGANIQTMSEKAQRNQLEFRPHFKTHQSKIIGRIFREFDVSGITVSSVKMAEYFFEDGWKDITIAFPANLLAAHKYNELAKNCDLKTLIISSEVVRKLDNQLSNKLGLYIEIDPEYGRSGIPVSDVEQISDVKEAIEQSQNCYLAGFYCHAGHTYGARSTDEVRSIAGKALQSLQQLKDEFPDISLCFGDTPSCSVLENFGPAAQISPGNFVFFDWMQVQIGSCSPDEIAVQMDCPVIEKFDNRNQILIHGGAVHFSKEAILVDGNKSFGQIITEELSSENYISKISQEHAVINCTADVYSSLNAGDIIQIYPIHSCLNANLMRGYFTKNGARIDHLNG